VEADLPHSASIDFAFLADGVAVAGDRIHALGAGWSAISVHGFPASVHSVSVAMRIRVPWSMGNERFLVQIDVEDEDGFSVLGENTVSHPFELGRPPGLPPGSDLGMVWAYAFNHLELPKPGNYSFVIRIDDHEAERIRFRAMSAHGH
jgi:hypothetical protein